MQQSGLAGTSVTVWGGSRAPHKEFVDYYAGVLNEIGLKATEKIVADAQYYPTVGNIANQSPDRLAVLQPGLPQPDRLLPAARRQIDPAHRKPQSLARSTTRTSSPKSPRSGPVPSSQLSSVVGRWQALDQYTAQKAYMAPFGYDEVPKFFSDRIDFGAAVFHPVYGNDWSTLELK